MIKKIREKGFIHYLDVFVKMVIRIIIPRYKRELIFEIPLSEYTPKGFQGDYKIKPTRDLDEIMPFILEREAWYLEHARRLIERGNLCFIAIIKGQIACCLWTSFGEVDLTEVKYKLMVDDHTVPLIDGYTLEPFRGLGIYRAVWDYCLNYFKDLKRYKRIYGFIVAGNKRSLKVHRKLQLNRFIMVITYIRILGFKIHLVKKLNKI